jgi:hypothetical protein
MSKLQKFWIVVLGVCVIVLWSMGAGAHYHDGGRIGSTYGIWIGEVYHICTYITPIQVHCVPG